MPFNVTTLDDVTVLSLVGEIDLYGALELKKQINEIVDEEIKKIMINLSELDHLGSPGLGGILYAQNKMTEAGGRMVLTGINENIGKILKISKVTSVLIICKDEKEALNTLRS